MASSGEDGRAVKSLDRDAFCKKFESIAKQYIDAYPYERQHLARADEFQVHINSWLLDYETNVVKATYDDDKKKKRVKAQQILKWKKEQSVRAANEAKQTQTWLLKKILADPRMAMFRVVSQEPQAGSDEEKPLFVRWVDDEAVSPPAGLHSTTLEKGAHGSGAASGNSTDGKNTSERYRASEEKKRVIKVKRAGKLPGLPARNPPRRSA